MNLLHVTSIFTFLRSHVDMSLSFCRLFASAVIFRVPDVANVTRIEVATQPPRERVVTANRILF